MKNLAVLFLALGVLVNGAADAAANDKKRDIAKKKARAAANIAAQGGIIYEEYKGNVIRFASAQKCISIEDLKEIASGVQRTISIPVIVEELEAQSNKDLIKEVFSRGRTGAAIVIVDKECDPALLIAPEDSWAVVNVRKLVADGKREKFVRRTRQEIWRALAFALNGTDSQMQPCIMTMVKNVKNLDRLSLEILSPEPLFKMQDGCSARNMRPSRKGTYRRACEQGWAPSPTNDVQKAIWAEFHAKPTEPMRIKFDPKKGE